MGLVCISVGQGNCTFISDVRKYYKAMNDLTNNMSSHLLGHFRLFQLVPLVKFKCARTAQELNSNEQS